MAPQAKETGELLGYIGEVPCYRCKLRGNGLTDVNSNWRLWNADMKVYRAANPTSSDEEEVFPSKDAEILARTDRRRKALMWFTVSENLREQHLLDLGGTDKSCEDVFRRLYERVAPPGTPYEPLEKIVVTDKLREEYLKAEAKAKAKNT
ncbi:hypothetical protein F4775DRAFT_162345 [Biscogniauxia sp. FL1348]|nr:hypothetical protein F4775DRAFT_162345 [Biscogniauxia sp. FL1348]